MNKKQLSAILVLSLIIVGGIGGLTALNNADKKAAQQAAMERTKASSFSAAEELKKMSMTHSSGDGMMDEKMTSEAHTAATAAAQPVSGSYTTYDKAKLVAADSTDVVLFFHAPWCPTCKDADANFKASDTPSGLTLLKVDYDSSTDLKRKHGVTYQHTFVQVDKDGTLIKKWNGSKDYTAIKTQLN